MSLDETVKHSINKYICCSPLESKISGLTKNHIAISMQKIGSIHNFIFEMRPILGSHDLNGLTILDHFHPKIIEITSEFPKISVHKITLFHEFFLGIIQFESSDQIGHTHFWPHPLKQNLNLYQHK